MYISLPSTYRLDFDITVKDCWVDSELVLKDGVPQTPLFGEFDETLKGVSTNQFFLFKSLDHLQSRDILFSCLVETCLDDCSTTTSFLRRRRSIISNTMDHISVLRNEIRKTMNMPLNNNSLKSLKQLVSRVQRRVFYKK